MKDFKHLIKKHINKIFIAVLAAAFITTAALTAVLGVNIYSIASSGDMTSSPDSAVSYITEKVRECEDKSNLRTATLGGSIPALVISSDTEENSRDTWIYVYDGYLKELTAKRDANVSAASGKNIAALQGVDFSLAPASSGNSLLQIDMTGRDSTPLSFCINLYGNGGTDHD